MPDRSPLPPDAVDPERPRNAGPFDQTDTEWGQNYSPEREAAEGDRHRSPHADMRPDPDGRDLPPGDGQRATVDPRTGAVRGSGMGAGGGQAGEDFDQDPATGSDYPITGGEGGR